VRVEGVGVAWRAVREHTHCDGKTPAARCVVVVVAARLSHALTTPPPPPTSHARPQRGRALRPAAGGRPPARVPGKEREKEEGKKKNSSGPWALPRPRLRQPALLTPPSLSSFPQQQATLVGGDASTDVTVFYRPGGLPDEGEAGGGKGRPAPQPLALTRLRGGGKAEAAALDLIFDHYAEFTAVGGKDGGAPAEVHLTGYELPDADGECVKGEREKKGDERGVG